MFQNELLNRLAKNATVTVMARGMLENILSPAKLDAIFQRHVRTQRQRTLLFSFVVELMLLVACKIRPKIHSAYKAWHEELPFKCNLEHTTDRRTIDRRTIVGRGNFVVLDLFHNPRIFSLFYQKLNILVK